MDKEVKEGGDMMRPMDIHKRMLDVVVIVFCILIILITSGCVKEGEEKIVTNQIETGVLIGSMYNRGWFDLPNSVELFFSDGTTIKIEGDSDNITRNVLYRLANFYEGKIVTVSYHDDFMNRQRSCIVCDSFTVVEED